MHALPRTFAVLFAALVLGLTQAHAVGDTNIVTYDPVSQGVTGALPAVSSYVLNVTCPMSVTTFPLTVTVGIVSTTHPIGDDVTALSYVHFSTTSLTFTSAGQTLPVTVSLNFPLSALSAAVPAGAYMYQINTTGWPSDVIDGGATISASVDLPPPAGGTAPTVAITTPASGNIPVSAASLPAQISFSFTATTDAASPTISGVSASFGTTTLMTPVSVTPTGLGTGNVSGSGTFTVSAPGTYELQVGATNLVGTGTDTHTYTVVISAPPPTVTIASPVAGTGYTYQVGGPAVVVPLTFSAVSSFGGIQTLTAQVDGATMTFTPTGIGTLTAGGAINLPYTTAGTHNVVITATDQNGTSTAQTNFKINVVAPLPAVTVAVAAPTPNQVFVIPAGSSTMNVNYSFTTTVQNGFNVDSVTAKLGTSTISPTTTGLGTATATSTGTLNLAPGDYVLTATGTSGTQSAATTVSFSVRALPTVVINTPPVGYTQTLAQGQTTAIPLNFTGTSHTAGGVITALSATCDGTPLTVNSATLGQSVATGMATIAVSTAGVHHIVVTATDGIGSATASRDFTIKLSYSVTGTVFFDLDRDHVQDGSDFGLSGITVKLVSGFFQVVGSTTTDASGSYSFTGVSPGIYGLCTTAYAGLTPTTLTVRMVTVNQANVVVPAIGYTLDFCALQRMHANGDTIGFWKNNLSKALAGKTGGVQVSAATLTTYTNHLADFALTPFDGLTMSAAVNYMSSTSSKPADLLAKQLVASEYNYEDGAYLNGNATLTFLFVSWGEYVLQNANSLPSTYVLWAKDWFDAYNNSNGGAVDGPDSISGCGSGSGSQWGCGGSSDDSGSSGRWGDGSDQNSGSQWGCGSGGGGGHD
ncbi:MAG TPA: SdrD B-like domain-containing protein [Opitutaceae bacterium]|nr:SdrD B-like domain-containing protein [Opitutaceae bacterium]